MGTLSILTASALVASSAWLLASCLGVPKGVGALLATYVIAWAEIVVVVLVLSLLGELNRGALLVALVLVFAGSLALAFSRQALRAPPRLPVDDLRDPVLAVLACAVGVALAYSASLTILTPPNDWDALTYHLSRAAFWIQQEGVGYVPNADVIRINVNPPNAEIGLLFTLLLSGGDRFAGFVQYAAALGSAVAIYGLARRAGVEEASSRLFGALLFLSLPVVVLQSGTALNDLVVVSFLATATYFLLGRTRVELGLGGVALALAVGAKFTAYISLPLLVIVVLVGQDRRGRLEASLAGLAGVVVGSYWLVVNAIETGHLDGGSADTLDQVPDRAPAAVLARTTRLLVGFFDDLNLGADVLLFPLVAAAFAFAVVLRGRDLRRLLWGVVILLLGAFPLVVAPLRELALRAHEKLWLVLDQRELAFLDPQREAWSPSTVLSFYGPLGLLLVTLGIAFAVASTFRGGRRLTAVLAAAPVLLAALVALAVVYDPWRGRFLLFGLALGAATWGSILRARPLAWGLTSIAVTTIFLSFVHSLEKPAGVVILDESTKVGIWGERRPAIQTWLRKDGGNDTFAFVARQPVDDRVGLKLGEDDFVFPYFGAGLKRRVSFVGDTATPMVEWLVVSPIAQNPRAPRWPVALETEDGWIVYRNPSTPIP